MCGFFIQCYNMLLKGDLKMKQRCQRNFMDSFQCGIVEKTFEKILILFTSKKLTNSQSYPNPFGMNPLNSVMTIFKKKLPIFLFIHTK